MKLKNIAIVVALSAITLIAATPPGKKTSEYQNKAILSSNDLFNVADIGASTNKHIAAGQLGLALQKLDTTPLTFPSDTRLFFGFDSETAGMPSSGLTLPWPYWFTNFYATNYALATNVGVAGHTVSQARTNLVGNVIPLLGTGENLLVDFSAINDIFYGSNITSVIREKTNLWHIARTNGMRIVTTTVPNCGALVGGQAVLTNWNAWVRSNWMTYADAMLDVNKFWQPEWLSNDADDIHANNDAERLFARKLYECLNQDNYSRSDNLSSVRVGDLSVSSIIGNVTLNGDLTVTGTQNNQNLRVSDGLDANVVRVENYVMAGSFIGPIHASNVVGLVGGGHAVLSYVGGTNMIVDVSVASSFWGSLTTNTYLIFTNATSGQSGRITLVQDAQISNGVHTAAIKTNNIMAVGGNVTLDTNAYSITTIDYHTMSNWVQVTIQTNWLPKVWPVAEVVVCDPPVITTNLNDQTYLAGTPGNFVGGVEGEGALFFWYTNGVLAESWGVLPAAIVPSVDIGLNDASVYFVASNTCGVSTSAVATITVTNAPGSGAWYDVEKTTANNAAAGNPSILRWSAVTLANGSATKARLFATNVIGACSTKVALYTNLTRIATATASISANGYKEITFDSPVTVYAGGTYNLAWVSESDTASTSYDDSTGLLYYDVNGSNYSGGPPATLVPGSSISAKPWIGIWVE